MYFCSHEHSRRRPNCPHVVNREYIKPASFDFILSGKSDDLAVKDITQRDSIRNLPPVTPARRVPTTTTTKSDNGAPPSTARSKKIRISVSTMHQPTDPKPTSTPNPKPNSNYTNFREFLAIFPDYKEKEILNWTMEELLDRLIKEKVNKFEEFLKTAEHRDK